MSSVRPVEILLAENHPGDIHPTTNHFSALTTSTNIHYFRLLYAAARVLVRVTPFGACGRAHHELPAGAR